MNMDRLLEIGFKKRNGEIKESWNELAEKYSDGHFITGEAYRCWMKNQVKFNINNSTLKTIEDNYAQPLQVETSEASETEDKVAELQKQKYQFQDQKRELNAKIRQIARFEHMKEEVVKAIHNLEKVKPLSVYHYHSYPISTSDGVRANILWSDWHYSQESDNSVNVYNREIFQRRLSKLVQKTIYYCKKHKVRELTIGQIGDMIAGFIHNTSRIETNEDVIEQTMHVSEYIAESIVTILSEIQGIKIKIINIQGNHARTTPNKEESIIKESFERLIPWHLETRLRNIEDVEVIVGNNEGYYLDESFKKPHLYIHGDLDYVSSVAKTIPQYIGVVPKYIWLGHYHNDSVKDFGRTTVVGNGSLCGTDSYASSKRLYSDAMQKMHIFNEEENIEYTISINLQNA